MPRLNVIDPANATGKAKELWDGPLKGKHLNVFKGLANSGAAFNAYVQFSGALKEEAVLNDAEREVIALTVGQRNDCNYCLAAHTMIGGMVGLEQGETINIRKGQPTDAKHQAIVKFVTALLEKQGNVSDDDLNAFRSAGYNDGAIVEVVGGVALNYFTNFFNHTNQTDVDLPAAPAV
jgi:uncharacterized peroxidase-related enzyme